MAKQAGPHYFTGTIGDLIFYKLGDNYYVRQKGSYNTKALQKPGARPLMQLKQAEFGRASKLASEVYRLLPRTLKKHGLFGQFTKAARTLLRQGKDEAAVKAALAKAFLPAPVEPKPKASGACSPSSRKATTNDFLQKAIHNTDQTLLATYQPLPYDAYSSPVQQKRLEFDSSLLVIAHDG